jgi:hypothetical protein
MLSQTSQFCTTPSQIAICSVSVAQNDEAELDAEVSLPIILETYRALADFKKSNRGELSLKKGDIVEVLCSFVGIPCLRIGGLIRMNVLELAGC